MSDKNGELDRRIKRTRQMIRDALISLIKEKGFDSVTVQEIAERADINRSTFYFHYKDKYDLLEQSNADMLEEFAEALQLSKGSAHEVCQVWSLQSAIRQFEHIKDNADYYKVMLQQIGAPGFTQQMKQMIQSAFYSKLEQLDPSIPKEMISIYTASAHFGVIEWWLANDMHYSPAYLADLLNKTIGFGNLRQPLAVE